MGVPNNFAGHYNANDYAYGCSALGKTQMPGPLSVGIGTTVAGAATVTLNYSYSTLPDSNQFFPLSLLAPITIGAETVTPTAITNANINAGQLTCQVTATFANAHGLGDQIASGTFGLQEAINAANGAGGGVVIITQAWYNRGGTTAIIQASVLPSNFTVSIEDLAGDGAVWVNGPSSTTVLAVPATATSAVVASQAAIPGNWAASTTHVVFAYVTAAGGRTLTSADYSFTATLNKAIGGTGPAAATGAVGYLVFMGTTAWQVPVIPANGTVITCGSIQCFQIGTPFSVAALTTSALATIPLQSTAFSGVKPMPFEDSGAAQEFQAISGPYAVSGLITAAGAVKELAGQNFPAGYFNYVNRAVEVEVIGYYTPVSTAQLTFAVNLVSVLGVTSTTIMTLTPAASSGAAASNFYLRFWIVTSTTGATGTMECHGYVQWGLATGTPGLMVGFDDNLQVVSAAVDLTSQLYLQVTLGATTANITTSQVRTLVIKPIS